MVQIPEPASVPLLELAPDVALASWAPLSEPGLTVLDDASIAASLPLWAAPPSAPASVCVSVHVPAVHVCPETHSPAVWHALRQIPSPPHTRPDGQLLLLVHA